MTKRERNTRILAEHFNGLERSDFCDFEKPCKRAYQKELSPTSKARKETSQNKFVKKDGVPDRGESFRKIDSSENRPRTWPGFVKSIRNGLKKKQNLIESSRPERKPAWRGKRTELDSRKKSRRDRMMR